MIQFDYKFITKFISMLQDQCVSITDLRTQTKRCLDGVEDLEKYVFVNNKPMAVIVGLKTYESMKKQLSQTYELIEMNAGEVSPKLRAKIAETKKMSKLDLVNI